MWHLINGAWTIAGFVLMYLDRRKKKEQRKMARELNEKQSLQESKVVTKRT